MMSLYLLAMLLPVAAFSQEPATKAPVDDRQVAGGSGAELGYDFCFLRRATGDHPPDTFIGLPGGDSLVPSVRAGFYLSQRGQIQTDFGISRYEGYGADSFGIVLGLAYLLELRSRGRPNVPYLRLGGLLRYSDDYAGYPGTHYEYTQLGVGGAVGLKSFATKRVAVRLEAGAVRWLDTTDILGNWALTGKVGVSVFTD